MLDVLFLSTQLALGQATPPAAAPMPMPIPMKMPAAPTTPAVPNTATAPVQPLTPAPTIVNGLPPGTIIQEVPATEAAAPEEEKGPSTLFMKAIDGTALGTLLGAAKTNISGFVDTRYTATNGVNKNRLPAGMGFSFNPDIPQFNWVTVSRGVDKESKELSFGYQVDTILYGSAYQYTTSRGLLQNQLTQNNGGPNRYGIDVPQHYLEFFLPNIGNGVDVQVGRRFARFGVESLNPTQSILPSYSYAFTYNPYTYTGVFTETKLTDNLTMTNDFTTGPDVWLDDATARFFWLGALQYDFSEKTNARAAVWLGNTDFNTGAGYTYPAFIDFVFNHKFGCDDKWAYAFEFLYGWTTAVPGVGDAHWYHFVNYLTYSWTDKLSTTGRVEFFDDVNGNRTGNASLYSSFSYGATWKPADWLMIRPELRYDRASTGTPFDGKRDFFGFTINGILMW